MNSAGVVAGVVAQQKLPADHEMSQKLRDIPAAVLVAFLFTVLMLRAARRM